MASRYTPRHAAWVNKQRTRTRRPSTQMLPAAAALAVAAGLVGSAGAAIHLSPTSDSSDLGRGYDPADIPPPDRSAQVAGADGSGQLAPLTAAANFAAPVVVASGACEAVYYSKGQLTANGESYDPTALTAAHRNLPFNTLVRVTNEANGESVVVRINDRATMREGRCLDLSAGAFASIADPAQGVVDVRYEVLAQDAT